MQRNFFNDPLKPKQLQTISWQIKRLEQALNSNSIENMPGLAEQIKEQLKLLKELEQLAKGPHKDKFAEVRRKFEEMQKETRLYERKDN